MLAVFGRGVAVLVDVLPQGLRLQHVVVDADVAALRLWVIHHEDPLVVEAVRLSEERREGMLVVLDKIFVNGPNNTQLSEKEVYFKKILNLL